MKRPGLTLVEVIVSIAITGMIFTLLFTALQSVLSTSRLRTGQARQIEQATRVLDYVIHTIREAQSSPTGAYPIVDATSSSLTIFSTISGSTIAQVRFFVAGTNLQQGIILPVGSPATYPAGNEQVTTILRNVQMGGQPLFTYFDENQTGSSAAMSPIVLNSIRLVRMQVPFDPDVNATPGIMTIVLNAELRNLKTNY